MFLVAVLEQVATLCYQVLIVALVNEFHRAHTFLVDAHPAIDVERVALEDKGLAAAKIPMVMRTLKPST